MKTILVTGTAGFIGSHFVDYVLFNTDYLIIAIDKLTYAGKEVNMSTFINNPRVKFYQYDICNAEDISSLFEKYCIDYVVNFAAESHVDNSIENPKIFLETNVMGTFNLINIAYKNWSRQLNWEFKYKFLQISTDEVYGSLDNNGIFYEDDLLNPSSPYSSSKASADLIALSYYKTYQFPVIITRSTNNFGPRQDKEKLIPKSIYKILNNQPIPIYGTGDNIRDWIFVRDNVRIIFDILDKAPSGNVFNIGGDQELTNIEIVKKLMSFAPDSQSEIRFVADRLGHDFRYAVSMNKTIMLLGEVSKTDFTEAIKLTYEYYLSST